MNEEESLIQKAQGGGEDAFGKLYDTYMPKIYRFVFLKTGRKQDAEDITHQVFLNAWQSIGSYKFQGFPFSSWLYRIASNAVIDHYRTRKEYQNIDLIPEDSVAVLPELEKKMDEVFEIKLVRFGIAKLDQDQQNVLVMKFIDELSNKEIAQAIGKSEGAVRVIQHRALKQLKQHVDGSRNRQTTQEA